MSSAFKLSLPTDIPWERICVTKDMLDDVVCDKKLPGKWRTSIAVFKYVPAEEYQLYPAYKITYLKVTATITGYQPLDKEIQGNIDWNGVDVTTIDGVVDLLNTYLPCHGAILQVAVGPPGADPDIRLTDYPFFLDFEPKKRELYEMATDTKERQSRSVDAVNVTKSAGSTYSTEVLDIDQGFTAGGSVSVFGTGAGFNYGEQGQWGTKNLNMQESMVARSSDALQEKRETYSHSTQLSQMYHLLDSYHLGTNRAVFFVQPRPHVLEEPSGFVRGPRPVEGIQEFFLVVADRKDAADFCVSVRLDTSHLTVTDILDYDRKDELSDLASVNVPAPTDPNDRQPAPGYDMEVCALACWDIHYNCYTKTQTADQPYTPPADYIIDLGTNGGFTDQINEATNGSTSVTVAPTGSSLTVHAEATSHICEEGSGVCFDCPDQTRIRSGSAKRQVLVHLVSKTPIKKVGTRLQMVVTTRGLCCCPPHAETGERPDFERERVTGVVSIPTELGGVTMLTALSAFQGPAIAAAAPAGMMAAPRQASAMAASYVPRSAVFPETETSGECPHCREKAMAMQKASSRMAVAETPIASEVRGTSERSMLPQHANAISDYIRRETLRSMTNPRPELQPASYLDTDLFAAQLRSRLASTRNGRALLNKPLGDRVPRESQKKLEQYFGKPYKEITVYNLAGVRMTELARVSGMKLAELARLRLGSLGIQFVKQPPPPEPAKPQRPSRGKQRSKK